MSTETVRCLCCPRTVVVVPWNGFMSVARHDNQNNSGFCKGSLEPLRLDPDWVDPNPRQIDGEDA